MMADFVKAAQKSEIPEDGGKLVEVAGREIALFRVGDRIYAIDQICPHAGGPLSEGGIHGELAMCPWHGWEFNVKTGECAFNPEIRVDTFEVKEDGEDIYVKA